MTDLELKIDACKWKMMTSVNDYRALARRIHYNEEKYNAMADGMAKGLEIFLRHFEPELYGGNNEEQTRTIHE